MRVGVRCVESGGLAAIMPLRWLIFGFFSSSSKSLPTVSIIGVWEEEWFREAASSEA